MSHAKYVPHCKWRNGIAVFMAAVTAGAWIPFVSTSSNDSREDEADDEFSVPPPLHEGHAPPSWEPVNLVKKPPKHAAPNPALDPTHARPTPKVTVHPTPKPVITPKPPPPPTSSSSTGTLVAFLKAQVGDRYVLGGNGPDIWDCSGLSKAAFARIGYHLPRTSEQQSLRGSSVSLSQLRTGDLLFWGVPGLAYHVGVYIGNGRYIAAQNPSVGVVERTLSYSPPDFARRIL